MVGARRASSSAARDVSVAAGVKRDAGSERFADKNALGDSATRAAKAAKTDAFAAAAAFEARVRSARVRERSEDLSARARDGGRACDTG